MALNELIFYHNYFTEPLMLPDNFGKFSAVRCKHVLKFTPATQRLLLQNTHVRSLRSQTKFVNF